MEKLKNFLKPKDSNFFEFTLKYFELIGFSVWKLAKCYKTFRMFTFSIVLCYWTLNLWNIYYVIIDFDLHLFMKLVSLSFIHLTGVVKYIVIVSFYLLKYTKISSKSSFEKFRLQISFYNYKAFKTLLAILAFLFQHRSQTSISSMKSWN